MILTSLVTIVSSFEIEKFVAVVAYVRFMVEVSTGFTTNEGFYQIE